MKNTTIENVLREFIADIDAVGVKQAGKDWPDLVITYNRAKMALDAKQRPLAVFQAAVDELVRDYHVTTSECVNQEFVEAVCNSAASILLR